MRTGSGSVGFDAARKEYVDLVQAGIIDPTKVVRVAHFIFWLHFITPSFQVGAFVLWRALMLSAK